MTKLRKTGLSATDGRMAKSFVRTVIQALFCLLQNTKRCRSDEGKGSVESGLVLELEQ